MFDKLKTIQFQPISAYTESCSSILKRIKVNDDNTFLIFENTLDFFSIYHIDINGSIIHSWQLHEPDGFLIDYIYLNGTIYLYLLVSESDYDERLLFYKSEKNSFILIDELPRESYQHDMDFFSMYVQDNECRVMLIRHNRLHSYILDDELTELGVIEGRKWVISGEYAINISGKEWELYDRDLQIIDSFRFEEEIDWLGVSSNKDNSIIAIATDNASGEIGGLYIYDKISQERKIHYQRYGFYSVGIACSKIWTSIGSMYSGTGGLMIYDKKAGLKFAHIRDESESSDIKAYHPVPIMYQPIYIGEVCDNKIMLADNNKIIITDISCRALQEIDINGYDTFNTCNKLKYLFVLNIENRLYAGDTEAKYNISIDIYTWNLSSNKARVVDLTSLIKYE